MIIGFHCIFTAYGFWLPNEPRGSYSTFVGAWDLLQFGPATQVNTRRSVAGRDYDHNLKNQMQTNFKHSPVRFTGRQALIIGQSMGELSYVIHALAIMPDHVHVVFAYAQQSIGRVVGHVKAHATRRLHENGWFADHTPWAKRAWHVYLDSDQDMKRAIRYVQDNPLRAGLRPQRWSVVTPYE